VNLTLHRYAYMPTYTLGTLVADDLQLATIERPWMPNPAGAGGQLSVSCVPDGDYQIVPHDSARWPNTYALVNHALGVYHQMRPAGQTWGRTAILIHVGNTVRDVIGCIAVGTRAVMTGGEFSVVESRIAMDKLRAKLGRATHALSIRPTGTKELG